MLNQLKDGFEEVKDDLWQQYVDEVKSINESKSKNEVQEALGESDAVRGFDINKQDANSTKFMDVYKPYLGDEYERMKSTYEWAVRVLNETYKLKLERLKLNAEVSPVEVFEVWSKEDQERFIQVYNEYNKGGQTWGKYMEMVKIQFPSHDQAAIDLMDSYLEGWRWDKA